MPEPARLPTHLEVAAWRRAVEAAGGFATIIHRGEREAGSVLVLTIENGGNPRLWERMPSLDGSRSFSLIAQQPSEKAADLQVYCERRSAQDPDLWIVELDVAKPERFIDIKPPAI